VRVRVALVLSVAACVTPSGPARARLAELHATAVAVELGGFTIRIDTAGDGCPALEPGAVATFADQPLTLVDAELGADGSCQSETIAGPPPTVSSGAVQLVIADSSATWTFDFEMPGTTLVMTPEPLAPGTSTVSWPGGLPLREACAIVDGTDDSNLLRACNGPDAIASIDPAVELLYDANNSFTFAFGDVGPFTPIDVNVGVSGAAQITGGTKLCHGPVWCRLEAAAGAQLR